MIFYYAVTITVLLIQAITLIEAWRHLIYTKRKYRPQPSSYRPRLALISPCKGSDTTFEKNIKSLFQQDYPDYEIFFVVESTDDSAYPRLQGIIQQQENSVPSVKAHLIVAGLAEPRELRLFCHNADLVSGTPALPVAGNSGDNKIVRRRALAAQIQYRYILTIPLGRKPGHGNSKLLGFFFIFISQFNLSCFS